MARPEINRKICRPPLMKGFRPFGIGTCRSEAVKLTFEEYESIRLINYEMLLQEQAAVQMSVSRPTITRIYNKATNKIAKALIEGKVIEFEGGNYVLEKDWYRCRKCHKLIEGLDKHKKCDNCPDYNFNELINLNNR